MHNDGTFSGSQNEKEFNIFSFLIRFLAHLAITFPYYYNLDVMLQLSPNKHDPEDYRYTRVTYETAKFLVKLVGAWEEEWIGQGLFMDFRTPDRVKTVLDQIGIFEADEGILLQLPRPHKANRMVGLDPNTMHIYLHANPDGSLQPPVMVSAFN